MGITMYLASPIDGSESLAQWASQRQTSMEISAPPWEKVLLPIFSCLKL